MYNVKDCRLFLYTSHESIECIQSAVGHRRKYNVVLRKSYNDLWSSM